MGQAATMWVRVRAIIPVLSANDHPVPPEHSGGNGLGGGPGGEVGRGPPQRRGGPHHGEHRPPPWSPPPPLGQDMQAVLFTQWTHTHPEATEAFQKKLNFRKLSGATKQRKKGYKGLVAPMWVPMGAQVPALSPNDHPSPSQGPQKGFGKSQNFEKFPLLQASLKTAEYSPARAHKWGRQGVPGVRTQDPSHWLEGP